MIKRGFVFTLSCSSKDKERKIAVEATKPATTTNNDKTTSAVELEHQFKGCKAHW
jgi:hypothetical protein